MKGKKQQPRFDIDFFEFSFLVEACIPPRPIARAMFWDDVVWKYYDVLTENERFRLFNWIQLNPSFKKEQKDCLLFYNRFDPDNQHFVETRFEGVIQTHDCFLHEDRYYTKKNTFIAPEFIVSVNKQEMSVDGRA